MISKACFLDNWWITFVSFLLSMLSLTALNLNISLIWKTQYSEDTFFLSNSLMFVIIICETLLTHGLIEAFSDFIFESVTIYWYFNETKRGQNYHRIINLFESLRLVFFHFSSIIYGFILAFIPEKLNSLLNKCS